MEQEKPEEQVGDDQPRIVGTRALGMNATFMFGAELSLALGRGLTFFLLGIALGSSELGRYVAVLGLTQLIYPVTRMGIAHVMVRDISTGKPLSDSWSKVVTISVVGGLLGSIVSVVVSQLLFDVSAVTVVVIGVGQLIGLGIQQAGGMAAAAFGKSQVGLWINGVGTLMRVAAVLIFFYLAPTQSIDVWAFYLFVVMLGSGLATVVIMARSFGAQLKFAMPGRSDVSVGAGFVFVEMANTAQADIDKVVLGSFGLDADAGVYAAAYRVGDLANLPLGALVRASYSEFFRRGSNTIGEAVQYARKLTSVSVAYGICIGIVLWFAAPLLSVLMGDEFADSVTALRWIAPVPAIRAAQVFPANTLTGIDRQWVRARLMGATAALNLAANVALVPRFGWRGAAVSTLIAESVFSVILWLSVFRAVKREQA